LWQENIKKNFVKLQELGVLNLAASLTMSATKKEAIGGKRKGPCSQKAKAIRKAKKRRRIVRYVA
jgi:hypothetical protein